MKREDVYMIAAGVAVVAVLYVMVRGIKPVAQGAGGGVVDAVTGLLGGAYDALPESVKPSSTENFVYKVVSVPFAGDTGDKGTFGTWLYDITH